MGRMVSFCGLDCAICPAFLSHKNNDQALRKKTSLEWSKMYQVDLKPEDINCVGCTVAEGVHIGHCSECEYRRCGQSKNLANCGDCPEYACAKLEKLHRMVPQAKANLDLYRRSR